MISAFNTESDRFAQREPAAAAADIVHGNAQSLRNMHSYFTTNIDV